MTVVVRFARQAGLIALFVAAALAGTLSGVLFAYSDDLPEVSALDNYKPNTITRVLGKDGQLVGEFAVERRVVVHYDDIPVNLRQAILAAEDGGFFQHAGLSISRMMLALARDIFSRGNVPGGSTLTQQLARNLFPKTIGFDRTWERKIRRRSSPSRSRSATASRRSSRSIATRSISATAPTAWRQPRSSTSAST